MSPSSAVIDDFSRGHPLATVSTNWRLITDRVMGGVSQGTMMRETVVGRPALRMRGDVSLENNGGFIQVALDLAPNGGTVDASTWRGIELDVFGQSEEYSARLRTPDLTESWQSYRQNFVAEPRWQTIQLAFERFLLHRTETPLDIHRLRRLGLVAIGRTFSADLALGGVRYFA